MSHFESCCRDVFERIRVLYLVPEFNALVSVVGEVLAGNKSTGALLGLQLAFLVNHPTLTQNQRRTPAALQTLKDVVF